MGIYVSASHCGHSSDDHQHCNATGSYSSFAGNDPNTSFGDLVAEKNITINGTFGQDLSVCRTAPSQNHGASRVP